jgi:hypothetical protein
VDLVIWSSGDLGPSDRRRPALVLGLRRNAATRVKSTLASIRGQEAM